MRIINAHVSSKAFNKARQADAVNLRVCLRRYMLSEQFAMRSNSCKL